MKKLSEIVYQFGEWFGRKTDRHKTVTGLDKEAWSFRLGTENYVVVLDGTGMQPETTKGVYWGVSHNKPCLLGALETFSELFYVPLGITTRIICPLQSVVGQLFGQFHVVCNIN